MKGFIGHQEIINNFYNRADKGCLSHAHLIVGEDGIGKSIIARIFALKILNKNNDRDYIDIVQYKPKKASFGVDDVRELIEEVNKKPYEGEKKVILIYEGNKLTVQAQNALLKTIEEPPNGVYIILLCESIETILDTIKSRCQIYKLTPLAKNDIRDFVITKLGENSEERINSAVAFSEGIPGKAEIFLRDDKLNQLRDILISLLKSLGNLTSVRLLEFEKQLLAYKDNREEILKILVSYIRDIMLFKELNNIDVITNRDKISEIKDISINISFAKLEKLLTKIQGTREYLNSNSNYTIAMRTLLMVFMEV